MFSFSIFDYNKLYDYIIYTFYLLFILTITGIYQVNPYYLNTLNQIIIYLVCFILLINFNPLFETNKDYSDHKKNEFNRKIAFSAGIYLLLTTSIINYFLSFIHSHII